MNMQLIFGQCSYQTFQNNINNYCQNITAVKTTFRSYFSNIIRVTVTGATKTTTDTPVRWLLVLKLLLRL